MKSGHCLLKMDPNLKKIEGNFNDKGILNGNTVLNYFDNTRIKGSLVNGVLHGLVRLYVGKNLCNFTKFWP